MVSLVSLQKSSQSSNASSHKSGDLKTLLSLNVRMLSRECDIVLFKIVIYITERTSSLFHYKYPNVIHEKL